MTWSNFFVTILSIYTIYYVINIVLDLIKGSKTETGDIESLSFVDDYIPIKIDLEETNVTDFQRQNNFDLVVEKEISVEDFKERKEEDEYNIEEVNTKEKGLIGGLSINELINLAKVEAIVKSKTIVFNV